MRNTVRDLGVFSIEMVLEAVGVPLERFTLTFFASDWLYAPLAVPRKQEGTENVMLKDFELLNIHVHQKTLISVSATAG